MVDKGAYPRMVVRFYVLVSKETYNRPKETYSYAKRDLQILPAYGGTIVCVYIYIYIYIYIYMYICICIYTYISPRWGWESSEEAANREQGAGAWRCRPRLGVPRAPGLPSQLCTHFSVHCHHLLRHPLLHPAAHTEEKKGGSGCCPHVCARQMHVNEACQRATKRTTGTGDAMHPKP